MEFSLIHVIDLRLPLTEIEEILTTIQFKIEKQFSVQYGKKNQYSLFKLYSLILGTSSEQIK